MYNYKLLSKERRDEIRKTYEFNSTNKIWNECGFNKSMKIGHLMMIAGDNKFDTFEEFEQNYFKSGEEREILISKLPLNIKKLFLTGQKIPYRYLYINTDYGRTKNELMRIAEDFAKVTNLSPKKAYNFVYIRIIDETWIGYKREQIAFKKINKYLQDKNVDYIALKSNANVDMKYAVDFEVYSKNKLILAIQLKSDRYLVGKSDFLKITKYFNSNKNKNYSDIYNVEVINIYINKFEEIINILDIEKYL